MDDECVEQSLLSEREGGQADIGEAITALISPGHALFSLSHSDEAGVHVLQAGSESIVSC